MTFAPAQRLLQQAVSRGVSSAGVIEVGRAGGVLWTDAFGRLRRTELAPATTIETVFDLASLTKVIATTALVQRALTRSRASVETALCEWLPSWPDQGRIRLRHLLDHSSGLPAHEKFWVTGARGQEAYLRSIAAAPYESPGARGVYSDLGFMLLGFALEAYMGQLLNVQFLDLVRDLDLGEVTYLPPASWQERVAATEVDPWRGRLLIGEVHDENAWALGGVAGHAGLFGTAAAVGRFARAVIRSFAEETAFSTPEIARLFARHTGVPSSSRALGWDTMRPASSCGRLLSPSAIGHTGFTGTSLWIDWERDVYVVLLTNRVHPTREDTRIQQLRPQVHDAIAAELFPGAR